MNKGFKQLTGLIIMVLFLVSVNTSPVFAHKMNIEEIQTGEIRVYYADGSSPSLGEAVLYSEDYLELYRGNLKENGTFEFPTDLGGHILVVKDGLGHQVRWQIGDDSPHQPNELFIILLVASFFIIIALLFHTKTKKKVQSLKY